MWKQEKQAIPIRLWDRLKTDDCHEENSFSFIVQWPGKVKPASTSDMVSATIDMMPTLCDLLKIPVPENVDGLSILPTILGKNNQQRQHEYLYFEYPEYGG
jgi:arylsulfatase